jgi:hypothetical protein
MARSLKHGPLATRTRMRSRSHFLRLIVFVAARRPHLVGRKPAKPDRGAYNEIRLLLGQPFRPLRNAATRQANRPGQSGTGIEQLDCF